MAKKACKKCKLIVTGTECPICKGNQFANTLQGTLVIIDPMKSKVAEKTGFKIKGEYAIKVR